jgi:hypothetical protein
MAQRNALGLDRMSETDIRFHGKSRHEALLVAPDAFMIKTNLDRHPLNDLGEIAGSIFGREQRESGS